MQLKAYAKVNLGLKIIGKRADGYHNIQSIFLPIDFYDSIKLALCSAGVEFTSNLPPYGRDNLCVKSAELFFAETHIKSGIKIGLEKHIWIGAGLGGGSSCAAQILLGMNELFDYPLKQEELLALGLKIGSDVPFFIRGVPALVEGRGEIITPLPHLPKPIWVALVYPNFPISTEWAYSKIGNYLTKEKWDFKILEQCFKMGDIRELACTLHNDFELVVFEKYPELKQIKEKLLDLGALGASVSGSGSCIYGIFEKIDNLELLFPQYKVRIVSSP
ncbi:MAG: 4-(cytidine 5'-diphospho)-2-C-methyl-D-erythritol kinase [Candidatus Stahlbacteria bacterium]|nr:4-(cytidine 5'-diphospho)-2-C-methyl-D-erythritol kinase [Candidatus Stahlbacteria bacterium]